MLLKIVNALLGLSLLAMLVSLPWMLELLEYAPWASRLHKIAGLALVALALLHVGLNFGWIRANWFGKQRK